MITITNKIKPYWNIFWSFCKISPLAFGGGYAMIPIIEKEVVGGRKWIQSEEMPDLIAITGSAPGAVGINTAVMIGYRIKGILGGITALLGMVLPTFIIVVGLIIFISIFKDNVKVRAALEGISSSVVALILIAALRTGKSALIDKPSLLLFAAALVSLFFFSINPLFLIVTGIVYGILLHTPNRKGRKHVPQSVASHYDNMQTFFGEGI